jgi:hypothetical protein
VRDFPAAAVVEQDFFGFHCASIPEGVNPWTRFPVHP